jgi:carboxylesterase type B
MGPVTDWDDPTGRSMRLVRCPFDADEELLSKAMGEYWGQFAATGTPSSSVAGAVTWTAYLNNPQKQALTMQLEASTTGGIAMVAGYKEADCAFWNELYGS